MKPLKTDARLGLQKFFFKKFNEDAGNIKSFNKFIVKRLIFR